MVATREFAGLLRDGSKAEIITLSNASGTSARILTLGATLQSLRAPDRFGNVEEITLGFDDVGDYERHRSYFGVTVGRYANRIAGGRFSLDGTEFCLPRNDGANTLHGGDRGFDRHNWTVNSLAADGRTEVVLGIASPHGEMGFPGHLQATVSYSLDESGALTIVHEATTDRPTIINLTNHAFFNLAGDGKPMGALEHHLTIPAARYLPVDVSLIPTGEQRLVVGTPFDFTHPRRIIDAMRWGTDPQLAIGHGFDHCYVLDKGPSCAPQWAARLEDPGSGRILDVWTTEPGLQFYSGNSLDGTLVGRGGRPYRRGDGVALEPQRFPDAPNQPGLGEARLNPGEVYRHVMIYKVSTMA